MGIVALEVEWFAFVIQHLGGPRSGLTILAKPKSANYKFGLPLTSLLRRKPLIGLQ